MNNKFSYLKDSYSQMVSAAKEQWEGKYICTVSKTNKEKKNIEKEKNQSEKDKTIEIKTEEESEERNITLLKEELRKELEQELREQIQKKEEGKGRTNDKSKNT